MVDEEGAVLALISLRIWYDKKVIYSWKKSELSNNLSSCFICLSRLECDYVFVLFNLRIVEFVKKTIEKIDELKYDVLL